MIYYTSDTKRNECALTLRWTCISSQSSTTLWRGSF